MNKKMIVSDEEIKKLLHDALYLSIQEEYRIHLSPCIFKIIVENVGSDTQYPLSLNITTNLNNDKIEQFSFSLDRKTIERICKVLQVISHQPVTINFGESGFEQPVISFCV